MTPAHTTPAALWGQCPGPSRFGAHTQLVQVLISQVISHHTTILLFHSAFQAELQSAEAGRGDEDNPEIKPNQYPQAATPQSPSCGTFPALPRCSQGLSRAEPPLVGTASAVRPPTALGLAQATVAIFSD